MNNLELTMRPAEKAKYRPLARTRIAHEEWAALAGAAGFAMSDHEARASIDHALSVAVGRRLAAARRPCIEEVIASLRTIAEYYRDGAAGRKASAEMIAGVAEAGVVEVVESAGRIAIRLVAGPVRAAEMVGGIAQHEAAQAADDAADRLEREAKPRGRPRKSVTASPELGLVGDLAVVMRDRGLKISVGGDQDADYYMTRNPYPRAAILILRMLAERLLVCVSARVAGAVNALMATRRFLSRSNLTMMRTLRTANRT